MTAEAASIRLLVLSRYADAGASSRMRMFQYFPHLREAGFDITRSALLDDAYLAQLYRARRRSLVHMGRLYLARWRALLSAKRFDLVWLEKECWPFVPALFDPGILARRTRYVADYDDAVFHNYDCASSSLVRYAFGQKIDAVMRRATLVMAGNRYLAARAAAAGAARIELIPTVVDLNRSRPHVDSGRAGLVVGWIGSPATQHLLEPLIPVLRAVLEPADRFVTIGANFTAPLLANHDRVAWSEETEAQAIAGFDVGVMPLQDKPFERGKCGFKLIQYMAAGIPVVASPVGVNSELVEPGVNGYLASSDAEWAAALEALRADRDLRGRMGEAGRKRVEERYSLQVTAPRVARLLRSAVAP